MQSHPIIPPHRLVVLTATARFWLRWLMECVARIAPLRGSRRLHAYVDRQERWIERVLFLTACARLRPPPRLRRIPANTPAGCRRRMRRRLPLLLRRAGVRRPNATLAERLAHLATVLDAPEPALARFTTRLKRGLNGARVVICAPRADALVTRTIAPAHADTS